MMVGMEEEVVQQPDLRQQPEAPGGGMAGSGRSLPRVATNVAGDCFGVSGLSSVAGWKEAQ
eukprot:2609871-Prorocentrum_lima.AAC.1